MRVRISARRWPDLPHLVVGPTIGSGDAVDTPDAVRARVILVGPATKAAAGPDEFRAFVEFVVGLADPARDVVVGILSAWLYDKMRSRPAGDLRLTIDGEEINARDVAEVERVVRVKLRPMTAENDGTAEPPKLATPKKRPKRRK